MDEVSLYTDGSCNGVHGVGAWAAIIFRGAEKNVLSGYAFTTTHQRMELTGVVNALAYLNQNNCTSKQVTLYTDSQYVSGLQARKAKLLATGFITKQKRPLPNADLITKLFKESANLQLSIIKVKSHQKDSYHERLNSEADKLCRKIVRNLVKSSPSPES